MQGIDDLSKAEGKILQDIRNFVSNIRGLTTQDFIDVREGIERLRVIRSAVYEDLNQIQHECLILQGLQWLIANGFGEIAWEWNPRQTGGGSEPDLRGSANGKILVSAEASASENPIGTIDSRMKGTLGKLGRMEGQKFYFVRTDVMACRARTKITKAGYPIKVVQV